MRIKKKKRGPEERSSAPGEMEKEGFSALLTLWAQSEGRAHLQEQVSTGSPGTFPGWVLCLQQSLTAGRRLVSLTQRTQTAEHMRVLQNFSNSAVNKERKKESSPGKTLEKMEQSVVPWALTPLLGELPAWLEWPTGLSGIRCPSWSPAGVLLRLPWREGGLRDRDPLKVGKLCAMPNSWPIIFPSDESSSVWEGGLLFASEQFLKCHTRSSEGSSGAFPGHVIKGNAGLTARQGRVWGCWAWQQQALKFTYLPSPDRPIFFGRVPPRLATCSGETPHVGSIRGHLRAQPGYPPAQSDSSLQCYVNTSGL